MKLTKLFKNNFGLFISIAVFGSLLSISHEVKSEDECVLYQLDFDNTSTYSTTCGTVGSSKWTVSNATCTLTTSLITLPGSPGGSPNLDIPISFEIKGTGNNVDPDYARFEYSVNGGAWSLLSGTSSNPVTGTALRGDVTLSYKVVNAPQAATLQVRTIFYTNNSSRKIDLKKEEGLCVSAALETGTAIVFRGGLPIVLTSFAANSVDDKIKLEWTTATEVNNNYFTIERSGNGASFEKITTVKGAGNSRSSLYYYTFDNNPIFGNAYYRLKQTDYDGKFAYSDIISVAVNVSSSPKKCKFKVQPNPCSGQCNVYIAECDKSEVSVALIDALGNEVYSKIPISKEQTSFSIDARNNLKPGVYVVMGSSNDQSFHEKIVVQ